MRKSLLTFALAVCLFMLIVGAKWATFDQFGSPMPDWDQWDAEALELLVPWFDQKDFLAHLFHPHNEHRVILTKLQNLALVLANGQWDSRLEAVSNALLHSALAVAMWAFARRWVATRWHAPLFLLTIVLFGLPVAWQNVLGGFHSQQYWLLGLSFAAIVTLPFARTWSARWWFGAAGATLALGSMGSGFLAAAVVLVLVAWRMWRNPTTLREVWPTLLWTTVLVVVGAMTRVEVYYHQQLKAKTAHDFIFSALRSLEWPLRDHDWVGAILWLPWVLIAWRVVRWNSVPPSRSSQPTGQAYPSANPAASSPWAVPRSLRAAQTITALGGWVLVQIVATAYARGAGADYPASRYMDTLTFGAMVNGIALAWLLSHRTPNGEHGAPQAINRLGSIVSTSVIFTLGLAWTVTLGLGLHDILERNLGHELPDAKKYYGKAEQNMRRYLATNDPNALTGPDLPYPSAGGLIERLSHPKLRALMPLPIRTPLEITGTSAPSEAFAQNDARPLALEPPPRAGLSPATTPLDASVTWGTYQASSSPTSNGTVSVYAFWQSAAISPPRFRWLKFETAGATGHAPNEVRLTLRDAKKGTILAEVRPTKVAGDTWRAAYVRTPTVPFVIVAEDASSAQWLAFSPPVEMGGLSYLAWRATKNGLLLVVLAGIVTILLVTAPGFIHRSRFTPGPAQVGTPAA